MDDDATGPVPALPHGPAWWVPWSPNAEAPAAPSAAPGPEGPEGVAPSPDEPVASAADSDTGAGAPDAGRQWTARRPPGKVLLVAAGAVAAVTVGIVAMNVAARPGDGGGGSPTVAAAAGAHSPAVASTGAPTTGPAPTGTVGASTATHPRRGSPSAAPAGRPSNATSGPASTPFPPAGGVGVGVGGVGVTVLNSTHVQGLAAREAGRLTAAGWQVRRVTSVRLVLSRTTVYYDAGQEAAARALVARVPSVTAMAPRPRLLLRTGGLIVVVAGDAV